LAYLKVQHSKTEWVVRTIEANPFQTEWFAWIDFALPHVFWDPTTVTRLQTLTVPNSPTLITPGIWPYSLENEWNRVQWRFAGGFMLGHASRFRELHEKMQALVIQTLPVNYWAMLEKQGMEFGWFQANHNDSMLTAFPAQAVQDPTGHLPLPDQ
jgi:hypothetical protein